MTADAYRSRTACMMRVKNEACWVGQSLERTFQVCRTVVVFDDGSTDSTELECERSLGPARDLSFVPWGWVGRGDKRELHFLYSPFAPLSGGRSGMRVNEIRDKRTLWSYCQTNLTADIFLCLDGDEVLSLQALREWPNAIAMLDGQIDLLHLNFIYIWQIDPDGTLWQRYDAIYGPAAEGPRTLNFPRIFTTKRVSPDDLFMMTFAWLGSHSLHCGSIPRQNFFVGPDRSEPLSHLTRLNVIHWGYCEDSIRRSKVDFYRRIDPNNDFEGNYNHCLGEPDHHAPGPVQLARYEDIAPGPVQLAPWEDIDPVEERLRQEQETRARQSRAQEEQWAREDAAFGPEWAAQQIEHRKRVREGKM